MSLQDQTTLRVVFYEGDGARPFGAAERCDAFTALLERGYAVTRTTSGGRVAPADRSALLVLGRFEGGVIPQAEKSGEANLRFYDANDSDLARIVEIVRSASPVTRTAMACGEAVKLGGCLVGK